MPIEPAPGPEERRGTVTYRMARRAVLAEVEAGSKSLDDVRDAHPELVRAATHHGVPAVEPCPLCDAELVHVSYVFGPRLPSHGRCVTDEAFVEKLRHRRGEFTRYVVEVCASCRWHHLDRAEPI